MTIQNAQKFFEILAKENGWREQLYVADPATPEEIAEFVIGKGFLVTVDELRTALQNAPADGVFKILRERLNPDEAAV